MDICTLASGSSGNALLICCGTTRILLDAGISARRITTALKELGIAPSSLNGVLVTHEHSDHVCGLTTLTKQLSLPVYAVGATARQLCYRIPFLDALIEPIVPNEPFAIGDLTVTPFATPHDSKGSVGYRLSGDGCSMALCTDLGHLTEDVLNGVAGAQLLVAEANHDVDWVMDGPYPYYLKQRILGDYGHLSNELGAHLVRHAVEHGTRTVILAHLSAENNTPARARQVVATHLAANGIDPERDIHLSVAPRSAHGPIYRLRPDCAPEILDDRGIALC